MKRKLTINLCISPLFLLLGTCTVSTVHAMGNSYFSAKGSVVYTGESKIKFAAGDIPKRSFTWRNLSEDGFGGSVSLGGKLFNEGDVEAEASHFVINRISDEDLDTAFDLQGDLLFANGVGTLLEIGKSSIKGTVGAGYGRFVLDMRPYADTNKKISKDLQSILGSTLANTHTLIPQETSPIDRAKKDKIILNDFIYQLGFGISMPVSNYLALTMDYRYRASKNSMSISSGDLYEFGEDESPPAKFEYWHNAHVFSAGFSIFF